MDTKNAYSDRHAGAWPGKSAGSIFASFCVNRDSPDIRVLGTEGRIHVHAPLMCPTQLTLSRAESADEELSLPFDGSGYQFQALEVHRCLRDGRTKSEVMPLAETLQIMETMDGIRAQLGVRYPTETG